MINEKIMYEKAKILSKRLGQQIEVEVYKKDDETVIISSNSLYSVFRQIDTKISITKTAEKILSDEKGKVTYCLCKCILTAGDYQDETFGESVSETLRSEIAQNNPFVTAERRAETKAIIRYLGLPGRVYSSDEIAVTPNKENICAVIEKVGEEAQKQHERKGNEDADVAAASGNSNPVTLSATEETVAAPGNNTEPEYNTNPFPVKTEPEETGTKMENAVTTDSKVEEIASDEDGKAEREHNKAAAMKKTVESVFAADTNSHSKQDSEMDLIVTFGPAKNAHKTVREVIADPAYAVFVENIQSGRAVPPVDNPEKLAIFNAILNAKKSA